MRYGYARVSSDKQSTNLQLDALRKAGCEYIFEENGVSGSKTSRPELDRMLKILNSGDTVVVYRLDRLGRSLSHLISLVEVFKTRVIHFESLSERIDTASAVGQLVFNIFGSFAQFEREIIRERTKAGIASAKQRGKKWNSWKIKPEGTPVSRSTAWRRANATRRHTAL